MSVPHISVCICTYKRPEMLDRLLRRLPAQKTDRRFTLSAVVVDNDAGQSAGPTVESFRTESGFPVSYHVEPRQNIALARNRALEHSTGDYIAFIDDDEFPSPEWLTLMLCAADEYRADGILGPVLPHFDQEPPKWVVSGRMFERPSHPSGFELDWRNTRTGNVLMSRSIIMDEKNRFDPAFGSGGEDRDFFRRMIDQGYRFVWSQEAAVYETVPPNRWSWSVLLRRALLRGQVSLQRRRGRLLGVVKSAGAILLYTPMLPFLFIVSRPLFMKYLIKLGDHVGRLSAAAGIRLIRESYITTE